MSPHAAEMLVHQVTPRIRSAVPHAVKAVGCEDSAELIQDTLCIAARLYENAERAGKTVTPGNITYYAIQHAKSGRRAYGRSITCPLHPATQLHGRAELNSFEEPVGGEEFGEELALADVFSNDHEDPATQAARKLDWELFVTTLNDRAKALVEKLVEGGSLSDVARSLSVSASTIQLTKNQLKARLIEFFGVDILAEVLRQPQWRDNLLANREQLACRTERMAS